MTNLPMTMTAAPNADINPINPQQAKPPLRNGRQELLLLLPMSAKERRSKRGQTRKGQELDPIGSPLLLHLALRAPPLLIRKSPSLTMYRRFLRGSTQWRMLDHRRRPTK